MAAIEQEREVHDWEREVVDLKRQGLETADISKAVDKHPATIRKAIAKARERGDLAQVDETGFEMPAPIEGQTTVDDFVNPREDQEDAGGNISPDLLPERDLSNVSELDEDVDPLTRFRAEAGEAVGEMQTRPGEEPAGELEADDALPVLPGTRQMALDFGPNAAPVFSAAVKFTSEKWPSGHFGAGDIVTGTFTARIVDTPHKEKFDKDIGEFVSAPTVYGALITEIEYEAVDPGE